jgi:4-amino-4-deoxy-L-arabinose transferase-like glycosyltransferase
MASSRIILSQKLSPVGWLLVFIAINCAVVLLLIPRASMVLAGSYNVNAYADGYDQLATNLADGNGYRFYAYTAPTLLREPGYPMVLAAIYMLFGRTFTLVLLANIVLASFAAYLITRIARILSASRLVVLGAPLLFLFHPGTLIAESRGGVEILFGLLLMLYMVTVYRAIRTGKWWGYLVCGAVLGLAVLVRSTPILFPIALLAYLLFVERQRLAAFRNVGAMVMAMFVVLSPWIGRNYVLTSQFVPTASVLGVSAQAGLYLSTHPTIGNAQVDTEAFLERNRLAQQLGYHFKPGYYQYFYSSADEVAFSRYLFKTVLDEYRKRPLLFIKTIVCNLVNFWCAGKNWKSVAMDMVLQFLLVGSAAVGVVACIRNGRLGAVGPMALLILYIVGVSLPILAQARYSAPLIPFLSILACKALVPDRAAATDRAALELCGGQKC